MQYRIAFACITIFLMLTLVLPIHSLVEQSNATGFASAPPIAWDRTYGGAAPDWGYSVVQTSDGGYAIGPRPGILAKATSG